MVIRRGAGLGQVVQHVAALLAEGDCHRQDALDKVGAAAALGSEA